MLGSEHETFTNIQLITFPKTITKLWINVGSNHDPILPPQDDASIGVIAVEPNMDSVIHIKKTVNQSRLWVLPCAISNFTGVAVFNKYNSVSGSLYKVAAGTSAFDRLIGKRKRKGEDFSGTQLVPTITLKHLLLAIPKRIHIEFLMTDMQGGDLTGMRSAGSSLRRVSQIFSEVHLNGINSYSGPSNQLHDFLPFMLRSGFQLRSTGCTPSIPECCATMGCHGSGGTWMTWRGKETDAYFTRSVSEEISTTDR